ncbi:MAG: hypothetical protein AAF499_16055 [Pseudomonadota bacterium]
MSDVVAMSLHDAVAVYESAVASLEQAIDNSVAVLDQQDSDALPAAIEAQQQRANALQVVQAEIKSTSASLGHGSLIDAIMAHEDSEILYPRYKAVQLQLKSIQKKLLVQAEAITRAISNNADLISLLTNTQPTGAYEENGQTSTTASNNLSARA